MNSKTLKIVHIINNYCFPFPNMLGTLSIQFLSFVVAVAKGYITECCMAAVTWKISAITEQTVSCHDCLHVWDTHQPHKKAGAANFFNKILLKMCFFPILSTFNFSRAYNHIKIRVTLYQVSQHIHNDIHPYIQMCRLRNVGPYTPVHTIQGKIYEKCTRHALKVHVRNI